MARPVRDDKSFTQSRAIVCEGGADAAFFRALIRTRNLPEFSIKPTDVAGGRGGNSTFGSFLSDCRTWDGFDKLKHIIIAVDCDDSPREAFQNVIMQISSITNDILNQYKYGIPKQPREQVAGTPASLTVLMIPWDDQAGALETVLVQATRNSHEQTTACVDAFSECVGAAAWSASLKSKFDLFGHLAANRKPLSGFGNLWRDDPGLVPLTDPAFDQISDFLKSFA